MLIFILQIAMSFASPEPCEKFDGADYDECVDRLVADKDIEIREEDRNESSEQNCMSHRSAEGLKACMATEKIQRSERAKKRKLQEEQISASQITHKPALVCRASDIKARCQEAFEVLVDEKSDENSKKCITSCSLTSGRNDTLISGCTLDIKTELLKTIGSKLKGCSTGVDSAVADKTAKNDSVIMDDRDLDIIRRIGSDSGIGTCTKNATAVVCKSTLSHGVKVEKVEVADSFAEPDFTRFISTDGTRFSTYQEALEYNLRSDNFSNEDVADTGDALKSSLIPQRRPTVLDPPRGGTSGSSSSGGSTSAAQNPRADSKTNSKVISDADGGSGSGALAPKQASVNPAGGSSSSSSSGGSGLAFSNPFGNSSIAMTNNNSHFSNTETTSPDPYKTLSRDLSDSQDSESVSGGDNQYSGSSTGSGSQAEYSGAGSGTVNKNGESEGVNRSLSSTPVITSSASVTPVALPESGVTKRADSLQTSAFQSGYYKAPSAFDKSGRAQSSNSNTAKNKKLRRKKIISQCSGDMQCLVALLGKSKLKKGSRGLASVKNKLPDGVWEGHIDILTHMANVYNKMSIDSFTGDLILED